MHSSFIDTFADSDPFPGNTVTHTEHDRSRKITADYTNHTECQLCDIVSWIVAGIAVTVLFLI